MDRQQTINRIRDYLVKLALQVQVDNKSFHFDLNRIAEDILRPVFQIAYKLPDLVNLNAEMPNSDALDLGDKVARTAFQVTSTTDKAPRSSQNSHRNKRKASIFARSILFTYLALFRWKANRVLKGGRKQLAVLLSLKPKTCMTSTTFQAKIDTLEIDEINHIEWILAKNLGDGEKYSFSSLKKACTKVSDATIRLALGVAHACPSPRSQQQISQFIESSVRYCFLTGPSSVGKSTVLALRSTSGY